MNTIRFKSVSKILVFDNFERFCPRTATLYF